MSTLHAPLAIPAPHSLPILPSDAGPVVCLVRGVPRGVLATATAVVAMNAGLISCLATPKESPDQSPRRQPLNPNS